MYSILEQFALGNISPENQSLEKGSPEDKALTQIVNAEVALFSALALEKHGLLTDYSEAQLELNHLTAVKNRIYGYKLGVLMTAEAFVTGGDLVAGA
ncbi:MAG: hypothetical protein FWE08_04270 [Oscillospiraceae bacterium]|nr:hypothetical protein [Oscillospiraceae bacterium]